MASDFDDIFLDTDAGFAGVIEPRLFEHPSRIVTTAHPFTEDDLRAFAASGEHPGLD